MWHRGPDQFSAQVHPINSEFELTTPIGPNRCIAAHRQTYLKQPPNSTNGESQQPMASSSSCPPVAVCTPLSNLRHLRQAAATTTNTTTGHRGPATGSAASVAVAMLSSGSYRYAPSTVLRAETETVFSVPYSRNSAPVSSAAASSLSTRHSSPAGFYSSPTSQASSPLDEEEGEESASPTVENQREFAIEGAKARHRGHRGETSKDDCETPTEVEAARAVHEPRGGEGWETDGDPTDDGVPPFTEPSTILQQESDIADVDADDVDAALTAAVLLQSTQKAAKDRTESPTPREQKPSPVPFSCSPSSPSVVRAAPRQTMQTTAASTTRAARVTVNGGDPAADEVVGRRLYADPNEGVVDSRFLNSHNSRSSYSVVSEHAQQQPALARTPKAYSCPAFTAPLPPPQQYQQPHASSVSKGREEVAKNSTANVEALEEELRQSQRLLMHSRRENARLQEQIKAHSLRNTYLAQRVQDMTLSAYRRCINDGDDHNLHCANGGPAGEHRLAVQEEAKNKLSEELVLKNRAITDLEMQLSALQGKLAAYEEAFTRGSTARSGHSTAPQQSPRASVASTHEMLCRCLSTADYLVKVLNATTHCQQVPHFSTSGFTTAASHASPLRVKQTERDGNAAGAEGTAADTAPSDAWNADCCPRTLASCTVRCLQASLQGNVESEAEAAARGHGVADTELAAALNEELMYCERVCVRLAGSCLADRADVTVPAVSDAGRRGSTTHVTASPVPPPVKWGKESKKGTAEVRKEERKEEMLPDDHESEDTEDSGSEQPTAEAAARDATLSPPPTFRIHENERNFGSSAAGAKPSATLQSHRHSYSPSPWNGKNEISARNTLSTSEDGRDVALSSSSSSTLSTLSPTALPSHGVKGVTPQRTLQRRKACRVNMQDCETQ